MSAANSSPPASDLAAARERLRDKLLPFLDLASVAGNGFDKDAAALRLLLAEQEAARRDSDDDARFAWLERHPLTVPIQHHGDGWRVVSCDRLEVFHGPTLRDAIDAAIQSPTTVVADNASFMIAHDTWESALDALATAWNHPKYGERMRSHIATGYPKLAAAIQQLLQARQSDA